MAAVESGAPGAPPAAPRFTVNDIFRRFGDSFATTHTLGAQQRKVLSDLRRCRTPALGGHIEQCDSCGYTHLHYHSCQNRHCPTCQCLAQQDWLHDQAQRVLPVPYFHVVFTLPAPLRPLCRQHRFPLFNLLFQAASATLLTFGKDPRHLGAQLGITAVLHTWTRDLQFHPHLHCIVTAGGLSQDGSRWVEKSPRYLFPVLPLSRVFRGKFLDGLTALFEKGLLPSLSQNVFVALLAHLRGQHWNVYAKPPFGGTHALYSYLGRYTHRTGISNQRLLSVSDQAIVFRTRGNKTCSLTPTEFIRRFLLHLLPPHFVKIRHYGLFASAHVHGRLDQARRLLAAALPAAATESKASTESPAACTSPAPAPPAEEDSGFLCPRCRKGRMRTVATLDELAVALCAFFRGLAALALDTS